MPLRLTTNWEKHFPFAETSVLFPLCRDICIVSPLQRHLYCFLRARPETVSRLETCKGAWTRAFPPMQARGKQYRRFCEGNTNRNIKRVGVLPIYENEGLRFSLTKGLRLKHPTSLSVYRHYTNLLYFALYFNRLLTKHTTLICGGKTGAT